MSSIVLLGSILVMLGPFAWPVLQWLLISVSNDVMLNSLLYICGSVFITKPGKDGIAMSSTSSNWSVGAYRIGKTALTEGEGFGESIAVTVEYHL